MSYRLAQAAMHSPCKGTAQHVLIHLADVANDKTVKEIKHEHTKNVHALKAECYPSQDYLADKTGYSRSTVKRALKDLKAQGFLTVIAQGKSGKSSHYDLLIPVKAPVQNEPVPPVQNEPPRVQNEPMPRVQNEPLTENYMLTENNNKELLKQASSIQNNNIGKSPHEEGQPTQGESTPKKALPACKDGRFSLREIADAALEKLTCGGMDLKAAKIRIGAVSTQFKTEATDLKSKGYPGINSPRSYLVAKLAGMAQKYTPPTVKVDPVDRDGILKAVGAHYKSVYKQHESRVDGWIADALGRVANKINGLMDAGWNGRDPITCAIGIFRAYMAEQSRYWDEQDYKGAVKHLNRMRNFVADSEAVLQTYQQDGASRPAIEAAQAKLAEAEKRLAEAERKVNGLKQERLAS